MRNRAKEKDLVVESEMADVVINLAGGFIASILCSKKNNPNYQNLDRMAVLDLPGKVS